tara:strand:+ start:490 stop:780 length:291 start_codon:yes stop_codon:yes gene_type:complete
MKHLVRIVWVVFILLTFVIAVLAVNQDQISLKFLSWSTVSVSAFWWLLAAFSVGFISGLLSMLIPFIRRGRIVRDGMLPVQKLDHGNRPVDIGSND